MLSSSVFANNRGADHRANSAASYAAVPMRQAPRKVKIRIRWPQIINIDNLSHQHSRPSLIAAKSARKQQLGPFFYLFFAVLWGNATLTGPAAVAISSAVDDAPRVAVQPELATKLTADFRTAFNDKPLRDALESIAHSRQINYWLDREVDPTTLVTTGAEARTAFQAIEALARSAGIEVTAIDNVVLIGRSEWLERTAAAAIRVPRSPTVSQIAWPALTTPSQAAKACLDRDLPPLPHDLWPAVTWSHISASLAHLLVAAQFDMMPSSTAAPSYVPLKSSVERFAALYPSGPHATAMRSAVSQADPRATVRNSGTAKGSESQLLINGSIHAHLAAIDVWLAHIASPAKAADIDQLRFTLRLENTAAIKVFRQLAATAGRQLAIHPEAADRLEGLVSFTANDQSLRELSNHLAEIAKVSIDWTDTTLTINPRD
ncbi:MAG: hypothetical protein ACO1RT_15620 [Planctomycetaceae bacterium]